jgi:hypothetical protein
MFETGAEKPDGTGPSRKGGSMVPEKEEEGKQDGGLGRGQASDAGRGGD